MFRHRLPRIRLWTAVLFVLLHLMFATSAVALIISALGVFLFLIYIRKPGRGVFTLYDNLI